MRIFMKTNNKLLSYPSLPALVLCKAGPERKANVFYLSLNATGARAKAQSPECVLAGKEEV